MEWDSTLLQEDDSLLLQQTPTHIVNSISPKRYSRIPEDPSKDTSNKENIIVNKCEGQKLNMEPVQMKKKRRGGGYNLRKSLAWDRAFFTEEGILDPLELSMISGTHVNSSRERLSTINEDDSLSNDCESNIDSADLQVLEENIFKEVPAASLKSNTVHLTPKHSPARSHKTSTSLVSPKVLPAHGASRAGSRGGSCARSLPLSSLKRPATVSASKALKKESKLPRIPISRPHNTSTLLNNKSSARGASNVKQEQTTQPAVIAQNQRSVAPKRSPKSVKHNQSKPKPGSGPLSVKASASSSKRNVVKSPIYPHSFTQLNPPAGNKVTNTGPKLILDNVGPSIAVPLPEDRDGSSKLAASLLTDTSTTISNKQHKQFPSMKPSGLRMPSPSLGFFGQPKASLSQRASRKALESDLRNPGYLKPPHSLVRVAEVVNDTMQTVDTVVLRSGSDSQAVSHETVEHNVREDAIKELSFSNEDKPSKPMNNKNAIYNNLDRSVLGCTGNRISTTGSDLEQCDLLPQENAVKSAKGVFRTRNSIENSLSGDLHHVSKEHGDVVELSGVEAVRPTGGNERLEEKGCYNRNLQNHSSENPENADFGNPTCMKTEQNSGCLSQERCEKLEQPLAEDDVTFQSHIERKELQMTNIISTSRCNNSLNDCSDLGDLSNLTCKSLEQSPYLVQYPQNNHGISATNCLSIEKDSELYTQEVTETLPRTILDATCKSEINNSSKISEVPVGLQNECFDKSTIVGEALTIDSVQSLVEITSSIENDDFSVTKSVGSDIICSSQITSSDSHSALDEASKSLVKDKCRPFNGNYVQDGQVNGDDPMVDDPENLTSLGACLESEIANFNCGCYLAENVLHDKDQNCNLKIIAEADPTIYDCSKSPMEILNISQAKNATQIDECAKEVISSSSNQLQVEDELVQELDCNVPVESCIDHAQLVSNQFTPLVASEESGEAGFPNSCIFVEKVPQINQSLIPDNCLSKEKTAVAESEENNFLKREVVDAVSETIDDSENVLESSRQVCSTPPPMHVTDDDGDIDNRASYVVHIMPGCVEVEPSSESCKPLTGNKMKHDVEHEGLPVEHLTSSSNGDQGANILKKNAQPDERKTSIPQDTNACTEESHNNLDAGSCLAKDKDITSPIKRSQSSSSRNSARIILPTNAVPFSDEWLAAMEAAGEDILKMKSGAVQNSPTEKPTPEPSPWSPVRRKNNPIGPFDCTKFTNNLPSDSQ